MSARDGRMLDLKTFFWALANQRREALIVAGSVLAAGLLVILSIPSKYVSGSRILVERQDTFVQTEHPGAATADTMDRRLQVIISTVLSTESIKSILVERGLVAGEISDEALEDSVKAFRRQADLSIHSVPVINQYTGKSGMYSQGIEVAFEDTDPQVAFDVAQSLTKHVLDANRGKGETAVEFQRTFLAKQHGVALERLSTVRGEIAEFKNENALYLPELQPLAIRRYSELEEQYARTEDNIAQLNRDLDDVRGELSTTSLDAFVLRADGSRILGSEEQLRLLEADYARATSRYGPDHPEVVRLRSELEGLRAYTSSSETSGIEAELQEARRRLSAARTRYEELHPEVQALGREIRRLENALAGGANTEAPKNVSSATNPAYNRLKIREQSIQDSITRERQRLAALSAERDAVEAQLARMPVVEKDLAALVQIEKSAQATFEEIDAERERLALSAGMQQADLLDRFILLEAPRMPTSPSKPQRKLLALVLTLLAGTAGLLAAVLLHLYRDRIQHADDVEQLVTVPVYLIPKFN